MPYMDFEWILEGALAAARGPTSPRDLTFLKLQEVKAIIRMEPGTISGESHDLADLFEPVEDGQPPTMEQISRMTRFIEAEVETWEHPVAVTCHAGLGRTGTVLACYMVYVGYQPGRGHRLHPPAAAGGHRNRIPGGRGPRVLRAAERGGTGAAAQSAWSPGRPLIPPRGPGRGDTHPLVRR